MSFARKALLALVLIPIVSLGMYAMFRKDLTRSKAEVKATYRLPNSHFLAWHGGELHYTESGAGMTVLMIHGFGGSNRDFVVLDSLIQSNYRVIRVDLPGFGLSDYPFSYTSDTTMQEAYSAYFDFMLDTLHIDSCYVMGNSMGGLMAMEVASQHPDVVRKMVLFNSAGYDMEEVKKSANADFFTLWPVQKFSEKGLPEFMTAKGIERVPYDKTMVTPEKVKRVNSLWNRQGNLRHIVEVANATDVFDQNKIAKIDCPTLIVWGKQDKIVNVKYAERFHHDIKGSQLVVYDKCGHVPMMEKPEEVKRDVLQFLTAN
jgi:pimeloyl-ACP methyl ester carboxylesterase